MNHCFCEFISTDKRLQITFGKSTLDISLVKVPHDILRLTCVLLYNKVFKNKSVRRPLWQYVLSVHTDFKSTFCFFVHPCVHEVAFIMALLSIRVCSRSKKLGQNINLIQCLQKQQYLKENNSVFCGYLTITQLNYMHFPEKLGSRNFSAW